MTGSQEDRRDPHILLVDDEFFILSSLQLYFESSEFVVSTATDGEKALRLFREERDSIDVVLLDLIMPGTHGVELLREFKAIEPEIQIIIATGCGTMGSAIEALRLGAFDFITKPILDFDTDLMKAVRAAIDVRRQFASNTAVSPPEPVTPEDDPVTRSASAALDAFSKLRCACSAPTTQTLDGLEAVLCRGFGAAAAAIFAPHSSDFWTPVHAWGSVDLEEVRTLRRADVDHEAFGGAWRRIVPMTLPMSETGDRVLVLYYGEDSEAWDLQPGHPLLERLAAATAPVVRELERRGAFPSHRTKSPVEGH